MIGNVLPLNVDVNARGVANARNQLGQMEAAVSRVGRSAGGLSTVMGRMGGVARSAFGGVGRVLGGAGSWLGRQATGLPGMLGVGLGVGGLVHIIKETADYDNALVSIQLALRLTDEETSKLNEDMARLAKETGQSRSELLSAARAATDFGVPLDKAVDGLREASLLAKVMAVPLESLAPALGGLEKLSGGALGAREQMALLYEAQAKSGLPEGQLLKLISQLGPQLAGVTGGDQRSLAFLMANIAAVGEAFAGPKGAMKLKAGLETLVSDLNDPRYAETFKKLGIDTKDLAGAEGKLLTALASGDKDVLKLSAELTDFLTVVKNSEGGMERFNEVHEATSGNLKDATDRVTGALEKMEHSSTVTWGQMIEQFKEPLIDLSRDLLAWFVDHKDDIKEGISDFISGIKTVTEWLADWWPAALAAALAGKAIPSAAMGGAGAVTGPAAVVGGILGAGLAELFGFGVSDISRTRGQTEAIRARSRAEQAQMDRAGSAETMAESDLETIGYLASLPTLQERTASAGRIASTPEEAMYLLRQSTRMAAGQPIEIHVHTSPDGAFTEAVDQATGRMVRTTTSVDGRQTVAAVG